MAYGDGTTSVNTATALDRNTGLPVALQGLGFEQEQVTTTSGGQTVGTTAQAESGSSSSAQSVDMRFSTPTAINALDQLILQLMGNSSAGINGIPGVPGNSSAGDLKVLFPDAITQFKGTVHSQNEDGTAFFNPETGSQISRTEAAMFNAKQEAKRIAYTKGEIDAQGKKVAPGAVSSGQSGNSIINGNSTGNGNTGELGTAAQQRQRAARDQEIERDRQFQGKYSKDAAFGDAQFLMNKAIHDALEQALPGITSASEGAGTSKGSMKALLTQRAAETGAREGGALGANLAVQYGGLNNQLAATLELLTRSDPNSPENMLLQAILGSKGIVQQGSTVGSGSSSSSKSGQSVSNTSPQTQTVNTIKQPLNSTSANPTEYPYSNTYAPQTPTTTPFMSISTGDQGGTLDQSYSGLFEAGGGGASLYESDAL